ncbi:hypothetical protein K439DRAFT_1622172 [Ramaria rubella]|nr:hypothetical protein K439DRAFT_1622172 [Ramaria rubella]
MPVIGYDEGIPKRQSILAHLSTAKDNTPQFHTVLVDSHSEDKNPQDGINGLQVAQVKLIFGPTLTTYQKQAQTTSEPAKNALAYVKWFSKPGAQTHGAMDMYAIHCLRGSDGGPVGGIIQLGSIVQPVVLSPCFPKEAQTLGGQHSDGTQVEVNGNNCLEKVDKFWINSFQDQATYQSVF